MVGLATLPGHSLTFPRRYDAWDRGGVASVESTAEADAAVEGVVYEITDADLASLDKYEGIDDGDYVHGRVRVHLDAHRSPIEVMTYFANPDPAGPIAPSRRYLDAILTGARHHGLSAGYIAQLAAIPTLADSSNV